MKTTKGVLFGWFIVAAVALLATPFIDRDIFGERTWEAAAEALYAPDSAEGSCSTIYDLGELDFDRDDYFIEPTMITTYTCRLCASLPNGWELYAYGEWYDGEGQPSEGDWMAEYCRL